MCQSAFSSDDYAKKDKCLVRPMSALAVTKSAANVNNRGNYRNNPLFRTDRSGQTVQTQFRLLL